ncbi:MAG: hypothetical protein VKK42_20065 [Lyngbya sp.]|nr:hypothetical protein [Lyngbya sp.]
MMHSSPSLHQEIDSYQEKLEQISKSQKIDPDTILEVLIVRDLIEKLLTREKPSVDDFRRIKRLDQQLKSFENSINTSQAIHELEELRQMIAPPHRNWWWWHFNKPLNTLDRFDWLFNLGTLFCLGFSFSITVQIVSRLIDSQGDLTLSILAAVQAALTLWVGKSLFAQNPSEVLTAISRRISLTMGVGKSWYAEVMFFFSLIFTLIAIAIRVFIIPLWVTVLTNQGRQIHNNYKYNADSSGSELSGALEKYIQAQHLDPENVQLQHYMGELYEDLGNLSQARSLYERVVEQDDYAIAYNNLGRLLILENNYSLAYQLLIKAYRLVPSTSADNSEASKTRYAVLKNLGWVRLEQKELREARDYLKIAIKEAIREEETGESRTIRIGAAHCLMAQVLEKGDQTSSQAEDIVKEWEMCKKNVDPNKPEEEEWGRLAEERTQEHESGRIEKK